MRHSAERRISDSKITAWIPAALICAQKHSHQAPLRSETQILGEGNGSDIRVRNVPIDEAGSLAKQGLHQ